MSASSRKSLASRSKKDLPSGCLRLFFIPFLLAGLAVVYFLSVQPMIRVVRAQGWEKAACFITSSKVASHSGSKSTTYSVRIVYQYHFAGQSYTGDRFDLGIGGSSSGRKGKASVVAQYPVGSESVCYVNPAAPGQAVLHRGLRWQFGLGAFGLIFVAVGVWGVFYAPRANSGFSEANKNTVPRAGALAGGPAVLQPAHSPMARFLGMLFFALVWNGFISIFVYLVFLADDAKNVPIFARIIVGLFAFIGLGIVLAAVQNFLALFNPRVVITAPSTSVALGGALEFRWSVKGNAAKLRKIRFILEGREEAMSRRGKNTSTDTQVFAEILVFESIDPSLIPEGAGRVIVPANLMHTFEARWNKVLWRLKVQGEIPRWPDVAEEYPIAVLPLGLRS